ncbi:MAG: DUF448 domain-containing protein [Pseudomonadota bacterium]|nr:DUF448 domain-containing protein [Pseudomonadota bacterium]
MAISHSSSDRGHDQADSSVPQRRCIVTGQVTDKSGLIRFVASPEGWLVADLNDKLGGRGAWVSADRHCLQQALSGNRFGRHLKQTVQISDGFLDHLENRLGEQLISRLSMMRKAGLLVTGGGKLRSSQTPLAGLLIADDASPREARQLVSLCQPDWTETDIPASWLGQISGSASVAYAGVMKSSSPAQRRLETLLREDLLRWRGVANAENTT